MTTQAQPPTNHGFGAISRATLATVIFALTILAASPAQGQTYTVLYNFSGGATGALPDSALAIDGAGNLYGTTLAGGITDGPCSEYGGCGLVFKLTHTNSGWVESVLYKFQGGTDGYNPMARLVFGPDGALYGVTSSGGLGFGTVYKVSPPPTVCKSISCPWTETILYRFAAGNNGNDSYPSGALVFDHDGNIYGTTYGGNGEVYELSPTNGGWTETILFTFNDVGLHTPTAGVIFDSAGNLYGPIWGGQDGDGAIYQLVNTGSGWTENTIYEFTGGADGAEPFGGLILDRLGSGCLFGTTSQGAGYSGTAFSLCPANGGWNYSLLSGIGPAGYMGPQDSLAQNAAGDLYGTDEYSVFQVGGHDGMDLHYFIGGEHGSSNYTGLVLDPSGNLYGTAEGGSNQCACGLIYEITP
jgi:hypothetical protein